MAWRAVPTFTTSPALTLLLLASRDTTEYAAKYGLPSEGNVVHKAGYIASLNYQTRTPNWVLQHLTKDLQEEVHAHRSSFPFFEDEAVPSLFRAQLRDYQRSGFSRGHLAAASDNKFSEAAMRDSFALSSNIVPQEMSMNGCDWLRLERMSRGLTNKFKHVFVVSGPMYLAERDHTNNCMAVRYQVVGPNQVAAPTHMFKVILAENDQGEDRAVAAFVMPNRPIRDNEPLYRYQVPLVELERSTGLRFFPKLDRSELTRDVCVTAGCEHVGDERVLAWRRFGLLKIARNIEELDSVWAQCEQTGFERDWVRNMYKREYDKRKAQLERGAK
ncbi:hypothetical protein PTSG_09377 [Salpingoeca rosetta]|uniref:Endonuclease n=1 Tax=Salpingoeca rosetta (strain ATCC 50818 / BSB-021) TaxID=946362 RepID=F2UMG1_SALR5|nr:uncharacterized protein PTSG_09377 [Salpingoeca rosetta]EGD78310.1 hypothetical protein PTSG_09377 [Salpingoeca rosetta]|eukprot:XP_004989633.1 hypothetical protein PTSG_09377 [Salpingoeca rosetta]